MDSGPIRTWTDLTRLEWSGVHVMWVWMTIQNSLAAVHPGIALGPSNYIITRLDVYPHLKRPFKADWMVFTIMGTLVFMDWFYVCLKVSFLRCFVFTLWTFKLLAFIDCFYVSLEIYLPRILDSTMWAWELFTFMDWFYVCPKASFLSCFVFTMWAWELLA